MARAGPTSGPPRSSCRPAEPGRYGCRVQLVLDWDGTVTERDTLDLVLSAFGDREIYERAEDELDAGRMTLNDVIATEFPTVKAPLDEVVAYVLEHARVRPGFAELARARRPLVVSSGFRELIEPVLEREGVLGAVELRANRRRRAAGRLARPLRVDETSARSAASRASAADLPDGEFVYVGDGYSDCCAALAADRVFVRDLASTSRALPASVERRRRVAGSSRLDATSAPRASWRCSAPPEPFDFELSTERFRAFGPDLANLWHDGGLHRVVGGARGADRGGAGRRRRRAARRRDAAGRAGAARRCRSTSAPSTRWAQDDPVLRELDREAGRLPAAARARPVRDARHLDHRAAGLALRGVRDPQPADRALRRAQAGQAYAFPTARALARRERGRARRARLLAAARPSTCVGLARRRPRPRRLAALPDEEVKARLVAMRGLGEWTADWFLARHLARPRAWPAGDLALRRRSRAFYPDAARLATRRGERFEPFQNLSAHYLLTGARLGPPDERPRSDRRRRADAARASPRRSSARTGDRPCETRRRSTRRRCSTGKLVLLAEDEGEPVGYAFGDDSARAATRT